MLSEIKENRCQIENIKSIYILDHIFHYIADFFKFKILLFKYSKSLQNKINIDLIDYKYEYLNNKFNISKFPYSFAHLNYIEDKNYLFKKVENELQLKSINLSINEIIDITKKYFDKYKNVLKRIEKDNFFLNKYSYIDIYYPFIDLPYYDNNFIRIPLDYIIKSFLKKDYISFFNKNNKYCNILIEFDDTKIQIQILKELKNIILNAKALYIKYKYEFSSYKAKKETYESDFKKNYINERAIDIDEIKIENKIFKEISLLINIQNKINILCLDFPKIEINNNDFKWLYNLKFLNHLELKGFKLYQPFLIIDLNLELINLSYCKNIFFDNEKLTKNIKYLKLDHTNIVIGCKYKFDSLEELNIISSQIDIDYFSLMNINTINSDQMEIFENMNNCPSLIKIYNPYSSCQYELKFLELILSNNNLKEIHLSLEHLSNIDLEDLEELNISNNTITIIELSYNRLFNKKIINIDNLLKKFLNIRKLTLNNIDEEEESFKDFIDRLMTSSHKKNILNGEDIQLNKIKPLFYFSLLDYECIDLFDSLEQLTINTYCYILSFERLQILSNNLKYCKKLKILTMKIIFDEIKKESYLEFIDKILSYKLKEFLFIYQIGGDKWNDNDDNNRIFYSIKELKKMFTNKINDYYLYKIPKIIS